MKKNTVEELAKKLIIRVAKKILPSDVGAIRSYFKGDGQEFYSHKVYEYGDDFRFIDWKMIAKTRQLIVKTFILERNREIQLIIDLFPSMQNGFQENTKINVVLEIITMIILATENLNEKISVILVSNEIKDFPLMTGRLLLMKIIDYLISKDILNTQGRVNVFRPYKKMIIDRDWDEIMVRFKATKKNMFFFSDFNDQNIQKSLFFKKQKIILVRIKGPLEKKQKFFEAIWGFDQEKNNQAQMIFFDSINELINIPFSFELNIEDHYLHKFVKILGSKC